MDKQLSFVFVIPTKYVGFIIGKSGMYRKRVMVGTSAQFNFQLIDDIPEHTVERTTSIFGPIPDIAKLMHRLLRRIDQASGGKISESDEDLATKEDIQKWLIPQSVCGSLIGRNGEGIKAIHRFSGAWVKIAHLDEFSNKHNERLVYIRGTPAQTQVAIRYISEYFGGRAFSTDEMVVSTREHIAVTVPNASLSFIFNSELDPTWFPTDVNMQLEESPVYLEPMVGEPMMRLIFQGPAAHYASERVLSSLHIWRSIHESNEVPASGGGRGYIPYSVASRQTTPEAVDGDSSTESKFSSMLNCHSSSLDSIEKSTFEVPEVAHEASEFSEFDTMEDVEDGLCGLVFVLTSASVNWFMSSTDATGCNFVANLMASTGCFIQLLPASFCHISKCVEVRKVSLIAPSKRLRMTAMEKIVHHILIQREAAVPALPIQAVLRKFCHNKEYANARYTPNRVKHPASVMRGGQGYSGHGQFAQPVMQQAYHIPSGTTASTQFAQHSYSYGVSEAPNSLVFASGSHQMPPSQTHSMGAFMTSPSFGGLNVNNGFQRAGDKRRSPAQSTRRVENYPSMGFVQPQHHLPSPPSNLLSAQSTNYFVPAMQANEIPVFPAASMPGLHTQFNTFDAKGSFGWPEHLDASSKNA